MTQMPLGSDNYGSIWRMKPDPVYRLPAEKTLEYFRDPSLYDRLFWSFIDKASSSAYERDGLIQGITRPVPQTSDLIIGIFIDIIALKTVMDPMATQPAKKAALLNLADTVIINLLSPFSRVELTFFCQDCARTDG